VGLRILIISRAPIGARMSAPGIRYVNMARVLRQALPDAEVVLSTRAVHALEGSRELGVVPYESNLVQYVRQFDVVIAMSFPLLLGALAPFRRKPLLVLDFFSQFHVEWMEVGRDVSSGLHRRLWMHSQIEYANLQLQLADYVLCANERQRDAYIGVLASLGRITPATYDADSTLRGLIDIAPHGVRPEPLPERRRRVKGRYPGIGEGDRLLLWLGGILYWYDPATLLRALARARVKHPQLKLLFLGSIYPGLHMLGQGVRFQETVDEAKRLGLWDTGVFMHPEWLPHEEVVDYLLDADAAVTTYFTNAETRFAHRTRFLDYMWARLPIICTEGDVLADQVQKREWGITLPERDEDAMVAALSRVAEDEEFIARCRRNLAAAEDVTWEAAFEPLVRFLSAPGGPTPIGEPRTARTLPLGRSLASYVASRAVDQVFGQIKGRFAAGSS
jgi:glycosyltransferase involved in cell wall biosynthesis